VKVMQTLYSLDSLNNERSGDPVEILKKNIAQSRHLFTYLVYFITEVARFAEEDARQKANKHLPTEQDLKTNTKIAGNELLWKVIEEPTFIKAVDDSRAQHIVDRALVRKVYLNLVETPEYKTYITVQGRDKKSEKKILELIFNTLMLPNEDFISHLEENFIHWDDDADMMVVLMSNFFQKPDSFRFNEMLSEEKWTFGKGLLQTVIEKREHLLDLIKPKLNNWDPERIAALDMILMQMGVAEFLYFETIPTKVTINEYIDLAKDYSTPQSGQFVNGILDNIHKELTAENKIHKKTFKNSTL
jgi:transcription antitermination protein NusB